MGGRLPNSVSEVSRQDVAFVVFKWRYSGVTEQVARWCAQRGCRIILLTDREANPLSPLAHLQFVTPSEGTSMFESGCASLTVLETLINLVAARKGREVERRTRKAEEAFSAFETFLEGYEPAAKRQVPAGPMREANEGASRKER
jgi:DNA-binding MurR/RpiR family transcriptional regulator